MERFFEQINAIIAEESLLEKILEKLSRAINDFFSTNGSFPHRVTVMLHDKDSDSLVTRVILDRYQGALADKTFFSGPKSRGIGRRIFDGGLSIYLRKMADWDGKSTSLRHKGQGSMLGATVMAGETKLGVITVSSDQENAFKNEQMEILQRVARLIAPAFSKVLERLDQLKLHEKFGSLEMYDPKWAGRRIYNAGYLYELLGAQRGKGNEVLLFFDVDFLKDINEGWSHIGTDHTLAQIYGVILETLRQGSLHIFGGDEFAVLAETDLAGGVQIAERIRKRLESPLKVHLTYDTAALAQAALTDLRLLISDPAHHPRTAGGTKNLNHGIVSAEVRSGRRGEFMLEVSVRKTVSVGVIQRKQGEKPKAAVEAADSVSQFAKHTGGKNRTAVRQANDQPALVEREQNRQA